MKFTTGSIIYLLIPLLLLVLKHGSAIAQTDEPASADTLLVPAPADPPGADSLALRTSRSGIDTVVDYSARDSTVFDVRGRIIRLYGDAEVVTGAQKLTAAYIEIDFLQSTLYAEARYDSATRRYYGVPVFRDAAEELSANTLTYNFKTKRGTLGAAETRFEDGFYYGEKIKRVSENILFVEDGRYTTCDAPHPHYFFSAPRMEVIVGDKVLADQVALNVADVPIFFIPFGIFFPSRGGKQSGLIIPQWSQSAELGFTLRGLGFFWAGTDYLDSRLTADLYSKGGFSLKNETRFALRGVIDVSNLQTTFGRTRNDPDEELTNSYIASYTHQMRIGRNSRLGGRLNFASQNAIRRNYTRSGEFTEHLEDITTQLITSDFSYSTSWDWGSASASFQRTQNIISNELDVSLPLSLSLPTWTPFSGATGALSALESFSLGYTSTATVNWVRQDTLPGGGFRVRDTRAAWNHQPTIGISPKLGYFTFQPSISYSESWFLRRAFKETVGDTVLTSFLPGPYRAYSWSAGANVSTRLYGILQPRIFGINAIRHTITPTIGLRYSPDFGKRSFGFYDEVFNPRTNTIDKYSIFEGDASVGSYPSAGLQQLITVNLRNEFEAKIAQGDTLEDRKVRLLSLGLGTAYNAAAYDNFRWSPVTMDISTELGPIGYVSGNASFSLYDQDSLGRRIPELLIKKGKGLWRVQNAGISFQTTFSDQGFTTGATSAAVADSAAARRERFNFEQIPFNQAEFFGEHVRGVSEFQIPWQIGVSGSYNVSRIRAEELQTSFNLSTTFSFSLTPTTMISSSGSYDFKLGKFLIPSISLFKNLHCWEMAFDWRPSGYGRGFYFRIGLKADQLRDIKLEQTQSFYN